MSFLPGISTRNTRAAARADSSHRIVPPCSSTTRSRPRARARCPCVLRGVERLEDLRRVARPGRPAPRSRTSNTSRPPCRARPHASTGPGRPATALRAGCERPARMRAASSDQRRRRAAASTSIALDDLGRGRAAAPPGRRGARWSSPVRTNVEQVVGRAPRAGSPRRPRARPSRAACRRPAASREQLRVALERRQRVPDLVREHRRHLAEARQPALALAGAPPRPRRRSSRRISTIATPSSTSAARPPTRASTSPSATSSSASIGSTSRTSDHGRAPDFHERRYGARSSTWIRPRRWTQPAVYTRADRRARRGELVAVRIDRRDVAQAFAGVILQHARRATPHRAAHLRRGPPAPPARRREPRHRARRRTRRSSSCASPHSAATSAAAISANATARGGTRRVRHRREHGTRLALRGALGARAAMEADRARGDACPSFARPALNSSARAGRRRWCRAS